MAAKVPFDTWRASVDYWVVAQTGMYADDLPDCPYRDWYDDGISPKTAAKRAIRNAKEG